MEKGVSRKWIWIGIIIIILIGGWLIWGVFQTQKIDFYSCTQDSDCIKVKGGCCGCSMGGTATAINKNFEKKWQDKLSNECQGMECLAVISNHPSCFKEPKCVNNKCILKQPTEQVTITTDKSEYEQGEKISASLSYDVMIYTWEGYEWSIQKWEDDSWVTILRKGDRYFLCANVPECKYINLSKIEECPPTVLCERPIWYEVKDTPKMTWDHSYEIEEKTFQCKIGKTEKIETWTCVVFGQVPQGKYKIRFEYAPSINPNNPFDRNVEIKHAEKEFMIK